MTGYTVHTGSNQKFTKGWDRIFQAARAPAAGKKAAAKTTKPAKKAAKTRKK